MQNNNKTITGEYTALAYVVYLNGKAIYQAGNSHLDSQGYVPAKKGVGIRQMREWCRQTAQELAKEHDVQVGDVVLKEAKLQQIYTGHRGKIKLIPMWTGSEA
jgi:hypothetical protein